MADSGEGLGGEQVMGLLRQLLGAGKWGDVPVQEIPAAPETMSFVQEERSPEDSEGPYGPGSEGEGGARPRGRQRSAPSDARQEDLSYWIEELRRLPEDSPRFAQVFRHVLTLMRAGRE